MQTLSHYFSCESLVRFVGNRIHAAFFFPHNPAVAGTTQFQGQNTRFLYAET